MSGVCPLPAAKTTNTFSDIIPQKDTIALLVPNAKFNSCGVSDNVDTVVGPRGDGSTVTNTVCCPTPGVPGPKGDTGCSRGFLFKEDWATATEYLVYDTATSVCNDDVVLAVDGNLYVCIAQHTSDASSEPGGTGSPNDWTPYWALYLPGDQGKAMQEIADGNCFKAGEMGIFGGCTYSAEEDVCVDDADPDTYPDFYLDGGYYWNLVSCPEEASWFDELMNGFGNKWMKEIVNWGLSKILGSFLADDTPSGTDAETKFNYDGGNVDNNYNGTESVAVGTSPNLQDVVSRLCDLCDIDSADYDVTSLPTTEINMTLAEITNGRGVLDLLSLTYEFGMIDIGTLKFIPHTPASAVKSLTIFDDLGYTTEGQLPPAPYTVKVLQAYDLPREVNLTYYSKENAHEKFVQTATLETQTDGSIKNLEVPMSLTEQEAYDIAERILVNAHIGRTTYSFTTSFQNIELEPEDIINVEGVGDLRILRIEEDASGGLLNMVCVNAANNDYTYTSSGISPAQPPTYIQTPKVIGKSDAIVFESPVMTPIDSDTLRFRIAPHGYGLTGWAGCDIYYSTDQNTWIEAGSATKEATWGYVATAISGGSPETITVEMKTGTLEDAPAGSPVIPHKILLGQEIIGFETATLISGTTYELTGLTRGMYGTEIHESTHSNKELLILLDDKIINFDVKANNLGKVYYFKFVTKGSELSTADEVSYTLNGKSRRPWQVQNLDAVKSCCTIEDWTISWDIRNQLDVDGDGNIIETAPEMFGGFRLNILNPGDDTVIRSVTTQKNEYVYKKEYQIEDFGSAQASIRIDIAQIDRVVGLGYNVKQTFTS